MAKIGLPKGSGKWLKVSEKSGNFEMDIEWQPCTKGSTCLLWDITTEKSGLCCYAVRITQNAYVKK